MMLHRNPLKLFILAALFYLLFQQGLVFPFKSLFKVLPILLLMVFASRLPPSSIKKKYLLAALVFSSIGDVALSLPIAQQLLIGLLFFLIAHLMYTLLFLKLPKQKPGRVGNTSKQFLKLGILIAGVIIAYKILPNTAGLWPAVTLYFLVIIMMAFSALACSFVLAAGAICFMFSDALIAFNVFLYPAHSWDTAVMASYYLAQCILVSGTLMKLSAPANQSLSVTY